MKRKKSQVIFCGCSSYFRGVAAGMLVIEAMTAEIEVDISCRMTIILVHGNAIDFLSSDFLMVPLYQRFIQRQ